MTRNNWIAHNITFLYKNAIANALVETKLGKGWDIVICLASGINISLLSQLPLNWIFVPFCGGNCISLEEKFCIIPQTKTITYGDLDEAGIRILFEKISIIERRCYESQHF